jgi:hypothetical protein
LADIYYICHHPLVSPERKRMSEKYSGDPNQSPRKTRTEWEAMSKLLSKHGVTMDMISADHLSELLLSKEDGIVCESSKNVRTCARRVLCSVIGSKILQEKQEEKEENIETVEVGDDEEEEEEEEPYEITRRLAKTKIHLFLSSVVTDIGEKMKICLNNLKQVSDEDAKVYNTPIGFLYLPPPAVNKDGKVKSEQSASSVGLKGKQAHAWDAKVKKQVASKKAIQGMFFEKMKY